MKNEKDLLKIINDLEKISNLTTDDVVNIVRILKSHDLLMTIHEILEMFRRIRKYGTDSKKMNKLIELCPTIDGSNVGIDIIEELEQDIFDITMDREIEDLL